MNRAIPYHFVTLTAIQLDERRTSLDRHGFYAWLSPIVLLAIVFAIRLAGTFYKDRIVPLSKDSLEQPPSTLQVQQRRIAWWLDQPMTSEFGARKVHILGVAYACWLLFLTLRQSGDDYLHLTKLLGHIAVSQLPFQYMMAIKSPRNPVQFATGLSHETLNPYHRLFGRIIHLFLAAHAVLYMNFFVMEKILSQRLRNWDVCLGLTAFCIFNGLAIAALPTVRRAAYHKHFYRPHVVLSGLLMPALFMHVSTARKYVYQMAACYIFNGAARSNSTSVPIASTLSLICGTNLAKLQITGPAWGVPPLLGAGTPGWVPGQHVYVKRSISPAMPRSPLTVVSLPPREAQDGGDESSNIDLVLRVTNGPMTSWLAAQPTETGLVAQNAKLFVEGPYGQARTYVPTLLRAGESDGAIMLVAGGVGATFTMPIYLSLLATRKSTQNIYYTWFVKSLRDAEWGLEMLLTAAVAELNVAVYITKPSAEKLRETVTTKRGLRVFGYGRRPEMKAVVDDVFSPTRGALEKSSIAKNSVAKVSVLACGPPSMTRALRKEVGKHVMRDGWHVWYHEEVFGLGP
ncbi:uncharacterized protein A1O5_06850 [Cladophialophora psammophila CBS 110553]|uniref:FAD-binding FR-type domain-containing protein n=1 Tax=Cladophialophora psammophila CBS 110553 TaxID=1182543 RepID=W9XHD9_9EURO|nr:uncharacterized protein A1O5_06850 [Cladophialophora psammophila CBS 110553]EXJ69779.1 hypothetical protein A1O5_06850 [Cladophialophora psammophila CBS 110553]